MHVVSCKGTYCARRISLPLQAVALVARESKINPNVAALGGEATLTPRTCLEVVFEYLN